MNEKTEKYLDHECSCLQESYNSWKKNMDQEIDLIIAAVNDYRRRNDPDNLDDMIRQITLSLLSIQQDHRYMGEYEYARNGIEFAKNIVKDGE